MKLFKKIFLYLIVTIFSIITTGSENYVGKNTRHCFVYVSLRKSNEVAIYRLNNVTGGLTLIEDEYIPGGPACLTSDPTKIYMYVAQRSSNSISTFNINPQTGHLQYMGTIKAAGKPEYISTDKSGNYLLTTYNDAGKAAIYKIDAGGKLEQKPAQILTGYVNPNCIQTDPLNEYVYLSDKDGNKIYQFRFESGKGIIKSIFPPALITPKNTGPGHFTFFKGKNIIYFINEVGNSVTAYHLNRFTGRLSEFQNISTLPKNFNGSSKALEIKLTPGNRFLYASNRGCGTIAAFSVNRSTGKLKPIGWFPTQKNSGVFNLDPSGRLLIAAKDSSGSLAVYIINKRTGKLTQLQVTYAGKNPSCVLPVEFKY